MEKKSIRKKGVFLKKMRSTPARRMIIFLSIVLGLFVLLNVLSTYGNAEKLKKSQYGDKELHPLTINQLNNPLYEDIILPDELDKKIQNEDDFYVYFYSPDCIHCQNTTPIVEPMSDDFDITLHKYNLLEFEQGWDKFKIEKTPTLIIL